MTSILWRISTETWTIHTLAIRTAVHQHHQMRQADINRTHMMITVMVIRRIMMMTLAFTQTIRARILAAAAIIRICNRWITMKMRPTHIIVSMETININWTMRFNHHKIRSTKRVDSLRNGHDSVATTHITKSQTVQTITLFNKCPNKRRNISSNTIAIKSTQSRRAQWIVCSTMAHLYSAFILKHATRCRPK